VPIKIKELPPVEELRRLFYVDDAGVLRWRISRANNVKAGAIAGYEDRRKNRLTYMRVGACGGYHYAHRIAYAIYHGECPTHLHIDHKNGDGLDNRAENLHLVDMPKNMRNQVKYATNTSGVPGVYWNKANRLWWARISFNGKCHLIGRYETLEEAVAARKRAEREYGYSERHGSERLET